MDIIVSIFVSLQDDYLSPRPRRELAYAYEPYLSYGYPVRAHEFRGLDTLMEGLRVLPTPALVSPALAAAQVTTVTAQSSLPQQQPQANQRRLYSAVLQNSPPSQVDEDELERQAMEQYRRGEDVIAQQFQVRQLFHPFLIIQIWLPHLSCKISPPEGNKTIKKSFFPLRKSKEQKISSSCKTLEL